MLFLLKFTFIHPFVLFTCRFYPLTMCSTMCIQGSLRFTISWAVASVSLQSVSLDPLRFFHLLFYYINTLKRELVDTNAHKLQPSLSKRVIVDGRGCHTALHFGVKAKENQDKVPTLYCLPKLHKNPIKQDLLLILVLVRQQNFLNY